MLDPKKIAQWSPFCHTVLVKGAVGTLPIYNATTSMQALLKYFIRLADRPRSNFLERLTFGQLALSASEGRGVAKSEKHCRHMAFSFHKCAFVKGFCTKQKPSAKAYSAFISSLQKRIFFVE